MKGRGSGKEERKSKGQRGEDVGIRRRRMVWKGMRTGVKIAVDVTPSVT
jgi:hypothetical protein